MRRPRRVDPAAPPARPAARWQTGWRGTVAAIAIALLAVLLLGTLTA